MRKLFGSKGKRNRTRNKAQAGEKKKSPLDGTQAKGSRKNRPPDKMQPDNRKMKRTRGTGGLFQQPLTGKHIAYGVLIIVGTFFVAAALRVLIGGLLEDSAARSEYDTLRTYSPTASTTTPLPDNQTSDENDRGENDEEGNDEDEPVEEELPLSFDELAAINPDFIGWISDGRVIEYPVVRGRDNEKYINTTFVGNRNTAGTVFMDYRHVNGFDEYVCILYGHNTRDGSMFSSLLSHLDPGYRSRNPDIVITKRDGTSLTYKVFAAIITDAWDMAYTIGISESARAADEFPDAPPGASRFLLLSTCTRSSHTDERVLIFAAMT